jgi:hypothetical protein
VAPRNHCALRKGGIAQVAPARIGLLGGVEEPVTDNPRTIGGKALDPVNEDVVGVQARAVVTLRVVLEDQLPVRVHVVAGAAGDFELVHGTGSELVDQRFGDHSLPFRPPSEMEKEFH